MTNNKRCKEVNILHCGLGYKTFFGGNLDFPKIKKLNKVGSDD